MFYFFWCSLVLNITSYLVGRIGTCLYLLVRQSNLDQGRKTRTTDDFSGIIYIIRTAIFESYDLGYYKPCFNLKSTGKSLIGTTTTFLNCTKWYQ